MSETAINGFLVILAIGLLFLAFQRWFWFCVFALGALASVFAVIASIIHFQILGAVGFCILAMILWGLTIAIAE